MDFPFKLCFGSTGMNKVKLFLIIYFIAHCLSGYTQGKGILKNSPFHASLELTTKYMWRGIEYGDSPAVFPMFSYALGGLHAFVMGGYALNGSHQEVDFGVSYSYKSWCFGLSDYYYPSAVGEDDKYFDFSNHFTGHSVESYLTFAPEKIPFWITLSAYVYGNDKKPDGNQAFSSYLEMGYNYVFTGNNMLSLFVGACLNKSFYTDYKKAFGVVNATLKYSTSFSFGKFQLPASVSYILNPYKEKSYLTFSFYFNS